MTAPPLSAEARRDLLSLARGALEAHFAGAPPPRLLSDRSETFGQARALFVTLRMDGMLRGCIGTLSPDGELTRMIPKYALAAALEDPRFPPLTSDELGRCEIEISVLTPPEPFERSDEIEIGRDGLIIESRGRKGLLLPQVATEWNFDAERFLEEVSKKAGLPMDAWRQPESKLWKFQAEVFGEGELGEEQGAGSGEQE
jgi:AmmeMemoRadiSam system protein A